MSKVKTHTAGMLRSLNTFGAGRQTKRIMEEPKVQSAVAPQEQMRERRVRVGDCLAKNAQLIHDGARG